MKNTGKYFESDFEKAFIFYLQQAHWQHTLPQDIKRHDLRQVILQEDLFSFLQNKYPTFLPTEIKSIVDTFCLTGEKSDFATLHKIYTQNHPTYVAVD